MNFTAKIYLSVTISDGDDFFQSSDVLVRRFFHGNNFLDSDEFEIMAAAIFDGDNFFQSSDF